MGGYFAGRLSEAGADVTFKNGLVIESPCGDFRKVVATVTAVPTKRMPLKSGRIPRSWR